MNGQNYFANGYVFLEIYTARRQIFSNLELEYLRGNETFLDSLSGAYWGG